MMFFENLYIFRITKNSNYSKKLHLYLVCKIICLNIGTYLRHHENLFSMIVSTVVSIRVCTIFEYYFVLYCTVCVCLLHCVALLYCIDLVKKCSCRQNLTVVLYFHLYCIFHHLMYSFSNQVLHLWKEEINKYLIIP